MRIRDLVLLRTGIIRNQTITGIGTDDIIVIGGPNGAGKSTLLLALRRMGWGFQKSDLDQRFGEEPIETRIEILSSDNRVITVQTTDKNARLIGTAMKTIGDQQKETLQTLFANVDQATWNRVFTIHLRELMSREKPSELRDLLVARGREEVLLIEKAAARLGGRAARIGAKKGGGGVIGLQLEKLATASAAFKKAVARYAELPGKEKELKEQEAAIKRLEEEKKTIAAEGDVLAARLAVLKRLDEYLEAKREVARPECAILLRHYGGADFSLLHATAESLLAAADRRLVADAAFAKVCPYDHPEKVGDAIAERADALRILASRPAAIEERLRAAETVAEENEAERRGIEERIRSTGAAWTRVELAGAALREGIDVDLRKAAERHAALTRVNGEIAAAGAEASRAAAAEERTRSERQLANETIGRKEFERAETERRMQARRRTGLFVGIGTAVIGLLPSFIVLLLLHRAEAISPWISIGLATANLLLIGGGLAVVAYWLRLALKAEQTHLESLARDITDTRRSLAAVDERLEEAAEAGQRAAATGAALEKELRELERTLADGRSALRLPVDLPRDRLESAARALGATSIAAIRLAENEVVAARELQAVLAECREIRRIVLDAVPAIETSLPEATTIAAGRVILKEAGGIADLIAPALARRRALMEHDEARREFRKRLPGPAETPEIEAARAVLAETEKFGAAWRAKGRFESTRELLDEALRDQSIRARVLGPGVAGDRDELIAAAEAARAPWGTRATLDKALAENRKAVEEKDTTLATANQRKGSLQKEISEIARTAERDKARSDLRQGRLELFRSVSAYVRLRLAETLLATAFKEITTEIGAGGLGPARAILDEIAGGAFRLAAYPEQGKAEFGVTYPILPESAPVITTDAINTGAREQVFLALRIARILEIEPPLPVILDDTLVNFDRISLANAAAAMVRSFKRRNQVIVLTCHPETVLAFTRSTGRHHARASFWRIEEGRISREADGKTLATFLGERE
jgi:uncharacterized protein YhaN